MLQEPFHCCWTQRLLDLGPAFDALNIERHRLSRGARGHLLDTGTEPLEKLVKLQALKAQRLARKARPRKKEVPIASHGDNENAAAALPGQLAPPTPSRELVARIQQSLASLGYNPGPADGMPGARTRAAIEAFQAARALPVTGASSDTLDSELLAALRAAGMPPMQRELEKHVTGSGFVVSSSGHILTNNHIVDGCRQVRIPPEAAAENVAGDAHSDLALLKMSGDLPKPATFRQGRGIRPGAAVLIAGFPLQGVLTSDLNITTGTVSALAGPGDDRRLMQVTAPVQPGNSGGPLLDLSGNIVGVVVGKLDAIKLARLTGDIPQNVNFAIQSGIARSFLDAYSVPYETAPSTETLPPAAVADRARDFTVLVECWK